MSQYGTLITRIGLAKIANAQVTQSTVGLEYIALGDGNGAHYVPTQDQTALVNEVWRGPIANLSIDPNNNNRIIADAVIPNTAGGFTIREIGLFDEDNYLIAVGQYPETYKPLLNEGISEELLIHFTIETANADVVKLAIDPTVIIASRSYVDGKVGEVRDDLTAHKADDVAHNRYGTASGTNAKTITLDPAPTALIAGMSLRFKNTTANTGAVTLNINGLGAKSIVKNGGTALSSGNLKAGGVYTVAYDGTSFILQGEGGEYGTAQPQHVLSPYTIGTEDGLKTGTILDRGGARTIVPSRTNQTLTSGYYSGNVTVQGNSNLLANNIRSGVNIFGVVGNLVASTGGREAFTRVEKHVSSNSSRISLSIQLNAGFPIIAYVIIISSVRTGSYFIDCALVNNQLAGGTYHAGELRNANTDRAIIRPNNHSFISGNTLYGDVSVDSDYGFPSQYIYMEAIAWG